MNARFNMQEIFEIAERIERNGEMFYRKAMKSCPEHQDFFGELAQAEVEHAASFRVMRKEAGMVGLDEALADHDQVTAAYLQEITESLVFDMDAPMPDGQKTKDVIDAAIQREKDTILFYVGVQAAVTDDKTRKILDDIIEEEMSHVVMLAKKKETLS